MRYLFIDEKTGEQRVATPEEIATIKETIESEKNAQECVLEEMIIDLEYRVTLLELDIVEE